MQSNDLTLQNHLTAIHNLEVKVGQPANTLTKRMVGTHLPSNTITNSKEQVNALSLRSEREVGQT